MNPNSDIPIKCCLVRVLGVPSWVPLERFLSPADWQQEEEGLGVRSHISFQEAADLKARLRGVVLDGERIRVECQPEIKRPLLRKALLTEARRMRQKTELFRRKGVKIDSDGRLFVTPEILAMALAKSAAKKSVIDGFCGLGGNAIAFARFGCCVEAYEIDRRRLELASHNAKVYNVKIRFLRENLLETISGLRADLLWLDPPWEEFTRKKCNLDDFTLLRETLELVRPDQFKEIWIKLPPPFDTRSLPQCHCQPVFGEAEGDYRRIKFIWARIK